MLILFLKIVVICSCSLYVHSICYSAEQKKTIIKLLVNKEVMTLKADYSVIPLCMKTLQELKWT